MVEEYMVKILKKAIKDKGNITQDRKNIYPTRISH